jgi:hypothetical protein
MIRLRQNYRSAILYVNSSLGQAYVKETHVTAAFIRLTLIRGFQICPRYWYQTYDADKNQQCAADKNSFEQWKKSAILQLTLDLLIQGAESAVYPEIYGLHALCRSCSECS